MLSLFSYNMVYRSKFPIDRRNICAAILRTLPFHYQSSHDQAGWLLVTMIAAVQQTKVLPFTLFMRKKMVPKSCASSRMTTIRVLQEAMGPKATSNPKPRLTRASMAVARAPSHSNGTIWLMKCVNAGFTFYRFQFCAAFATVTLSLLTDWLGVGGGRKFAIRRKSSGTLPLGGHILHTHSSANNRSTAWGCEGVAEARYVYISIVLRALPLLATIFKHRQHRAK